MNTLQSYFSLLVAFMLTSNITFGQTCPTCANCEVPASLSYTSDASFLGDAATAADDGCSMTLSTGANNNFVGHEWAVDAAISGVAFNDICIFADFEVTADFDLSLFPVTVEFRIENKGATPFPAPWIDFNMPVTANGPISLGGNLTTGSASGNGAFDPTAVNPNLVVAIANFSGNPLPGNITVTYSNLIVTDGSGTCVPAFMTVANDQATICSGGLGTEISDWQAAVEAAAPGAKPSNIVYSSVPDTDPGFPNTALTDGTQAPACGPVGQNTYAYSFCSATNTYDLVSQYALVVYPEPVSFAPTGTVDCNTNPEVTSACNASDVIIEYSIDGGSNYSTTAPAPNLGDPDVVVNWRVGFTAAAAAACTPASGTYTITCGGAAGGTCTVCGPSEEPNALAFIGGFPFGQPSDATMMTLPSGANGSFSGYGFQLDQATVSAIAAGDICISGDFVVNASFDPSTFPITLEFRIINDNGSGNLTAFNSTITANGPITLGGNVAAAAGSFDSNGGSPTIIVAVANTGAALPGDLVISYSNIYLSDGTCVAISAGCDADNGTLNNGAVIPPANQLNNN